ncbi:MAG: DUF5678 domain-containing protein [Candidatus Hodarchaeales archaeon]
MSITESIRWVHSNYEKLLEKYSGKYLAIFNSDIIAVGETIGEVETKVELILKNNGEYLVEFIDRGDLHAYSIEISNCW